MNKHATFLVITAIFVCSSLAGAAQPQASTTQPAAAWAKLPPQRWPQLVLTNKASFAGHTALQGASAFLIRMPDGEVMVGTAKHLIKEAGGVDPPIRLRDLDQVLTDWKVFPRTKPNSSLQAKGLAETRNRESAHDWLLLQLVDPRATLPATPLAPRLKPAEVGETVYLIGVPYDDHQSSQNVYKGVVSRRPHKSYFTYEFTPPVHISGFSGAPIVDANGLLLGHGVSMGTELKQQDGLEIEFGGEDAVLAVQLWQHRDDPPTTQPAELLHLDLPEGWAPKASRAATVLKSGQYLSLSAYFELGAEAKADFAEDVDLMEYARRVKSLMAKGSKLENRQETDLVAGKVADRPTVEFEMTGDFKNLHFRYRIITLEVNGCFCKLVCWTTPAHWDAAQAKFEDVVRAMK